MDIKSVFKRSDKKPPLAKDFYLNAFNLTVLITGLGYLVDTFDFFLYNSMRVVSLTELGLSGDNLTKMGIIILNCQIFGALLGSFFWGVLGDKKGRKNALLGSILLYSLGMMVNASVDNVFLYAVIRFIIGFGVAGEVGLGATLVAETVKSSKRTYALMFFTILGVFGVVIAGTSIEFVGWRISCFIGGVFGLLLLTLRGILFESKLFTEITQSKVNRGSLKDLFTDFKNLKKYLLCIPLLGCNFFVTGLLLTLAPEVAKSTDVHGTVKANIALVIYFLSAVLGDLLGAWLSEIFKSRNIVIGAFIFANLLLTLFILQKLDLDQSLFYMFCACFGFFNLWAISGTVLVEQFPTTLRATASTSNINCSRAMIILMNFVLLLLKPLGINIALQVIALAIFGLALFCIWSLPESYGRSLNEM